MNSSTPKRSEVDLQVAQELKNNRDFIYQTNQSIGNLNKDLTALTLIFGRVQSQSLTDKKAILIEFENFAEGVIEKVTNFSKRLGEMESKFEVLSANVSKNIERMFAVCASKADYDKSTADHGEKISDLQDSLERQSQYFEKAIESVHRIFRSELQSVKDCIPIETDLQPLQDDLQQRFDAMKVDFEGVARELALIKKALAYGDKKFENIYTLIDRLKESK